MQHSMRVRWFSRPILRAAWERQAWVRFPRAQWQAAFMHFFPSGVFYCCVVCSAGLDTPAGDGAYAALHFRVLLAWLGLFFFLLFWRAFLVYLDAELTPGYRIHVHMQTKKRRACCW